MSVSVRVRMSVCQCPAAAPLISLAVDAEDELGENSRLVETPSSVGSKLATPASGLATHSKAKGGPLQPGSAALAATATSAAASGQAGAASSSGWVYLGDPACEPHLPRYVVCMVAICTLCFFANGCEHAVATWLSSFGIQQRQLGEETMAIMTSNFWTVSARAAASERQRASATLRFAITLTLCALLHVRARP